MCCPLAYCFTRHAKSDRGCLSAASHVGELQLSIVRSHHPFSPLPPSCSLLSHTYSSSLLLSPPFPPHAFWGFAHF